VPNHETVEDAVAQVVITQITQYFFPEPSAKCVAHGRSLCVACARNPGDCANEYGPNSCSVYGSTGMHWDTCPNRVRDESIFTIDRADPDD
jgi:hypothetical protein